MSSGRDRMARKDAKNGMVRNWFGDAEKQKANEKRQDKRPWLLSMDRKCHLCGCPLHFAQTTTGSTIPLDLRAHIYAVAFEKSDAHAQTVVVRSELAFVSHFFTCPEADRFGKHKKKGGLDAKMRVDDREPGPGTVLAGSDQDAGHGEPRGSPHEEPVPGALGRDSGIENPTPGEFDEE